MDEKSHPTEGIPRPDWTEHLKANLTARFFGAAERTEEFCRILKQHNALVAGGFLLKAIYPNQDVQNEGWKTGDIDLYVNLKNTKPFMNELFSNSQGTPLFKPLHHKHYLASLYCRSFMRRNGIRGVKTIAIKGRSPSLSGFNMDMVSIRNRRTPVEVVTNFDLTFCQVWFDGERVYATHPDHIDQRRGQLQGDYVETYLTGNRFLRKRVEKYRERGFEITFDHTPSDNELIDQLFHFRNICHLERPYEELVKHAIYRTLCLRYSQRKGLPLQWWMMVTAIPGGLSMGSQRNEPMWTSTMEYITGRYLPILRSTPIFLPHEGYDSTEEEDMKALRSDPTNEWTEERFQRNTTNLFVYTFSPIHYIKEDEIVDKDAIPRMNLRDSPSMPFEKYILWRSGVLSLLPKGTDMFGAEGPLLMFHEHDAEGGITPVSLQTYVTAHYAANGNQSPTPIPCFYQEKCNRMLTTAEQQCVMPHEDEDNDEDNEDNDNEDNDNEDEDNKDNEDNEDDEDNDNGKEEQEEQEEQELQGGLIPPLRGGGRALRYTRSKKKPSCHKGSHHLTRKRK